MYVGRSAEERRMHIVAVHVQTQQFNAQKKFYTQTLGLPLVSETHDEFVIQTGNSQLAWKGGIEEGTLYHIAFTIPRNKFPQAKKWIQGKIPLLTQDDHDEFISQSWNSHSLYFLD